MYIPVYPHVRVSPLDISAAHLALPLYQAITDTRAPPPVNVDSDLQRVGRACGLWPSYDIRFMRNDEKAEIRAGG